jgi:uncharacterized protein (DUF2147 family)
MRMRLKPVLLLLGGSLLAASAQPGTSPEGNWLTEKKSGIIKIFRCSEDSDVLCGKLVWFRIKSDDPNPNGLDLKNPEPSRRDRPLCDLTFMYGFKPAQPNGWEGGAIYDPDDGDTYHATMKLRPDGTLDLHGYIGISLIGRSEIWTRYPGSPPACPSR